MAQDKVNAEQDALHKLATEKVQAEQQKKAEEQGLRYKMSTVNQSVLELVDRVKKGLSSANDKVQLNPVSDDIAARIHEITGVDVHGFSVAIEARQIEHILKDHGENGASDQSMANPEDIAKVEYALENPDAIRPAGKTQAYVTNKNGRMKPADTVLYEKQNGDGSYYVVQAVPDTKKKTLYVVTAFIGKSGYKNTEAPQSTNANSPGATPAADSAVASNNSISDPTVGVNGENTSGEGQVVRNSDGAAVQIADVESAGGGKLTVRLTDGSTADIRELSFPNVGEQELWRVLAEYADHAETARQLLKEYRAGDLQAFEYAKGVEEGFLYGKLNISDAEMSRRGSYVNLLNPMQKNMAYRYGQYAGEKQAKRRKAESSERNAKRERKGGVYYGYEGQTVDKSKLSKAQRVGVSFAEQLARRKGITTYFYRFYVNEQGQRVYKDREGNIVPANDNGWYDPSDGSIHIDLNCGDMGSTVLCTIAHELTHFIQDWSADKYRILCKILTEGYLEMGQSVDELVRNKQEEYRKRKIELSYEEAFDEVIASSMEGVLNDGRVMDLLDDVETRDMSLADRIRTFLEETAELIRDTIQAYRDVKPESPEGRIVQRMQGIHDQLQEVFAEGLHEGGENYRQGGKINTAHEGGVKHSLKVFEDGTRYVDVQADASIFANMTVAEMNRKAKAILMARFAGKVIGIDNRAFVNGDSVNEYLHPSKNIDRSTREAKLAAGSELDNLLDAGVPLPNESDGKDGHVHPDVIDFSYLRTIFKVGNEYFEGIVNIKNIAKGKLLKDITKIRNITKDIVSSYGSNPKSNFLRDVSMDSIRNSQGKVNKKSIRYQKNSVAEAHLQRENAAMGEDVAGLNELVAAMKRQGKDGSLETGTLDAAASMLMKNANARGNKSELMKLLDRFYQYVGSGQEMTWSDIRNAARPVVNWLMDHVIRNKQMSEYAKAVLAELRTSRIYLDESQKKEAEHLYGSFGAFRQMLMGSLTIANEGSMSLDARWHELSQLYPDVFKEDISAADMPRELMEIVKTMRNSDTSELEFEYNRDLMEQELLYRIYGSYWNASTLYIVAGQHEAKIRQLKGRHNQRMNEVYQRHRDVEESQRQTYRQRQETARRRYEEQYQKREAEYRESRRKAVERHEMAQVRQQIRKDVQHLDSLLNKGTKNKNVKLGLQDFVGAALRLDYKGNQTLRF